MAASMQSVPKSRSIAATGSPTSACALTRATVVAAPGQTVSTGKRPRTVVTLASGGGQRGRRRDRRRPVRRQQDEHEARAERGERGQDERDAEVGGLPDRGRAQCAHPGPDVPQGADHAEHAAAPLGGHRDRDEREPRGEERGQPGAREVGGRVEQEPRETEDQRDAEERDREARGHGDALSSGAVRQAADPRSERDVADREDREEDAHLEGRPAEPLGRERSVARDPAAEAGADQEVRDEQDEQAPGEEGRAPALGSRLLRFRDYEAREEERREERHGARRGDRDERRAEGERRREQTADRRAGDVPG